MLRRTLIFAMLAALGLTNELRAAESYPTRPVRILLGFPAGTSVDVIVRLYAERLQERLKQPFVVENRVGASGNLATEDVARANPDGYTMLAHGVTLAAGVSLFKKLPFDLTKDLTPVTFLGDAPYVLVVNSSLNIGSVSQLIAMAKADPGKLTYGSPGIGTGPHLATELLSISAGIKLTHVPYRGTNQAILDLLAGRISLMLAPVPTVVPMAPDRRLTMLAVSTVKRSSLLSDLPTLSESGVPGFDASIWYAMWAPMKTPADGISAINRVVVDAMGDAKFKALLAANGAEPLVGTPDQVNAFIKSEIEKWRGVVASTGLSLD